jgi:hypothetical protein
MGDSELLRLAHGLEWLGSELDHYGRQHAHAGFPIEGPVWDAFAEQQRGVLLTADKLEHELKNAVPFNPAALLDIEFPLAETLDLVVDLLNTAEEIKQAAVHSVQEVPPKVRSFNRMLDAYLSIIGAPRKEPANKELITS